MLRNVVTFLITSFLMLGLASCQSTRLSQEEITGFIDEYEKQAEFVNRQLGRCQWEYYTENKSDSLDYYRDLQLQLFANPELLARMKNYRSLVSDDKYRQKLDKIYRIGLRRVIEYLPEIRHLTDSLMQVSKNYQVTFEGKASSMERVEMILGTNGDRTRRKEAYLAVTASGIPVADGLKRLARLRNQATVRMGYNSYFDLMLKADGIDRAEFNELIQQLDDLTAAPYRRLLDSLTGLMDGGPVQMWDVEYILGGGEASLNKYFAVSDQLTLAKSTLRGIGLNIDEWPIYTAFSNDGGMQSEAILIPVHVPQDVRLIASVEQGYRSMAGVLRNLGRAVYAVHIDETNYFNAASPAPCFDLAMSAIIQQLMDKKAWLLRYAGIPEPEVLKITSSGKARNLINLRLALVALQFEKEMYKDPYGDLDQIYKSMFEKYMFFPPQGGSVGWASNIDYIKQPVSLQNKLFAQCIVEQTYGYIERKYGSIVDNQHMREFLVQNYYRFGGITDWRTLVARGTGEELNTEYILNYCKSGN